MSRQPVLFHPAQDIAAFLQEHPGEWFLIAGTERDRMASVKQTAHRIRSGRTKYFPRRSDGVWEVRMTAALDRDDPPPLYDVEMTARWVPNNPGSQA